MTYLMTQPMTETSLPAPAWSEPVRPRGVRRVLLDSGYALSAFFLALPAFIVVVIDLSLGLGLLVLVGGLLLLWVGVMVARGFARFERMRLRGMLGKPAPTPAYLCPRPEDGFWRKALLPLRDAQSWLDVLWCIVGLITGTIAFSLAVAWWAAAAGGLTYWFWQRWIPEDSDGTTGLADLLGFGGGRHDEIVVNLVIGAFALLTLPLVMRFAAALHGGLAHLLLSSRAELQQEVRRVEGGRDAAREAEAASLRRLERDIHDGPQQRLVRLTMDLGRARRQLADDPERASETIDAALLQARETVDELRSLSRGIAPPLLVDRGLTAALGELTVRSEVPSRRPSTCRTRCRRTSRPRSTSWSPRRSPTSRSTARRPVRRSASGWRTAGSRSASRTTAWAAPTPPRAAAWPGCTSGCWRPTAGSR